MLVPGEQIEANNGYAVECPATCKVPSAVSSRRDQRKMRGWLCMRHETINERLKNFHCLKVKFHHLASKHVASFWAIAVLAQLAIKSGKEMFDMREYDDRLSDAQVIQLYGL
jgi:hypothetical protein